MINRFSGAFLTPTGGTRALWAVAPALMLGAGLVVCVLAISPGYIPGMGRYDFPKAVAFHLAILAAAPFIAARARQLRLDAVDMLLVAFLVWSGLATVGAANPWWALGAAGLTLASLATYWAARACTAAGYGRYLAVSMVVALAVAAGSALLESYGLVRSLSVDLGAPGGVIGLRNRMAHLLVLGLPFAIFWGMTVRRRGSVISMACVLGVITAALVLSRTRAAWLAVGLVALGTAVGVVLARRALWRARIWRSPVRKRLLIFLAAMALGVGIAVSVPNRLSWSSPSPFRDTLHRLVDAQSGSGRGRLLQYRNTLRIVADHPVTGVGPGNWPVAYPRYAPPGDPSYHPERVAPVYAFPHGDWLGIAAERGIPALVFLLLAGALLFGGAWRTLRRTEDAAEAMRALALQGTLIALGVIGLVDPVLPTPVAPFLVFLVAGMLAFPREAVMVIPLGSSGRRLWAAAVTAALVLAAADRSRRYGGVLLYATRYPGVSALEQAARLYPGDFYAKMLLARALAERGDCTAAAPYLEAGEAIYPSALEPGRIRAYCERPPPVRRAPEVLSTNVIFAPRCGRVIYTSNRDGRMAPYAIELGAGPAATRPLAIPAQRDLLARSLSAECGWLALVGDQGGNGRYDVFLYDIARGRLRNLTSSPGANEGEPEFAPRGSLLAYLAGGALALYDAAADTSLPVARSPGAFTALVWSAEGDALFLEDRDTHLWRYDLDSRRFARIWTAPRPAHSPRMMYHHDSTLYFISDHESEFTQIYALNLASSRLSRLYPSRHDQYAPRLDRNGDLVFRTNVGGNFVAMRLRDGSMEKLSPDRGVTYDLSLDFSAPLLVYAGERQVGAIYAWEPGGLHAGAGALRREKDGLRNLIPSDFAVAQPSAEEIVDSAGMTHFVYRPAGTVRGWIVWLHGGPNEQVSPRFNLYYDFLVRLGYAVIAINYPGSTGLGNAYELRGVPDSIELARQLTGIDDVLAAARAQYGDLEPYTLVGVSYGSTLGFLHARRHPEAVAKFIDFSGATEEALRAMQAHDCAGVSSLLLIQGVNDPHQRSRARRALLSACARTAQMRRVTLPDEGHFIRRRGSIERILGEIERYLTAPAN